MEYFTASLIVGLAMMVSVVGMPHGGLDHLFGRELLQPRYGRNWIAVFGLAYMGVGGIVLTGWFFASTLTIVMFFLISALHFGDDVEVKQPLRMVEGGMVIWVPLLCRPSEVTELLAWVVPFGDAVQVRAGILAAQPLLWAIAVFFVVCLPYSNSLVHAARNLAFITLFAFAPTLVSFAVYFCCWHSIRELIALARRADQRNLWKGLRRVLIVAAPISGISVLATVATAWCFAGQRDYQPVIVQAVFLGLSAVAVPHILLHALARRFGADPFSNVHSVLRSPSHADGATA